MIKMLKKIYLALLTHVETILKMMETLLLLLGPCSKDEKLLSS